MAIPLRYPLIYEEESPRETRIQDFELSDLIRRSSLPKISEVNGQTFYDQLSDFLRTINDAQFGIKSSLNANGEWVRDATNAFPLGERMSHEAPVIEANNALLRCLSCLKAVDYAISKKMGDFGEDSRDILKEKLEVLAMQMLLHANGNLPDAEKLQQIRKFEEGFNSVLIEHLHKANLTKGCNTKEDAEKLLSHYRNLSSLMQPARTLVTLTYDKEANVFQRETQYPVTEKTEVQHEALEKLKAITPYPFKDEKNSHTVGSIAAQEADSLFYDLMIDDRRCLSAQARKTHLEGVKNAFIVKNELIFLEEGENLENIEQRQALPENNLWLARTSVPVYVGPGESSEKIQEHTQENLEQIRKKAQQLMGGDAPPNIHVTCLNTYSPLQNQARMVDHLYEATRFQNKGDDISYMPTNPDGTFRPLNIASGLKSKEDTPSGIAPLQKATRLQSVSKIILRATENSLSLVQCASGQDRTGTAVEYSTQEWMKERYQASGRKKDNIQAMRAEGGNAAEIASHLVPGSPGMKKKSVANNVLGSDRAFNKKASEQLYLKSASTNKQNRVNAEKIAFLTKPSQEALKEYHFELDQFKEILNAKSIKENKKDLYEQGQSILKNINTLVNNDPTELDPQSLMQLTMVLHHCTTLLTNQDPTKPETQESLRRIASLSQEVSGKKSAIWKGLGAGLISFACLAVGVVAVLAAIPTGGSSLLLTAIAATTIGVTATAGMVTYSVGREKDLAKGIKDFRASYLKVVTDNKDEEGAQSLTNPSDTSPHK